MTANFNGGFFINMARQRENRPNIFASIRESIGQGFHNVGTALNLPELNISERFGVSTAQAAGPQVLGSSISSPNQSSQLQSTVAQNEAARRSQQGQQQTSGGGGGAIPTQIQNPPLEQTPSQQDFVPEIDITPALEAFGQAEAAARSNLEANLGSIGQQITEAQQAQESEFSRRKAVQESEAERLKRETGGLVSDVRREAAEVQRGLSARFGGQSVGRLTGELASREAQRQIGEYQATLQRGLQAVQQNIEQALQVKNEEIANLIQRGEALKQQARAELDAALRDIALKRGEVQVRKAELTQQAVLQYRQIVQEVETRNTNFKQQLFLNEQKASQALSRASQQATLSLEQAIQQIPVLQGAGLSDISLTQSPTGKITLGGKTGTGTKTGIEALLEEEE